MVFPSSSVVLFNISACMVNEQVQWLIHTLVKDELMRKMIVHFPPKKALAECVDEPLIL